MRSSSSSSFFVVAAGCLLLLCMAGVSAFGDSADCAGHFDNVVTKFNTSLELFHHVEEAMVDCNTTSRVRFTRFSKSLANVTNSVREAKHCGGWAYRIFSYSEYIRTSIIPHFVRLFTYDTCYSYRKMLWVHLNHIDTYLDVMQTDLNTIMQKTPDELFGLCSEITSEVQLYLWDIQDAAALVYDEDMEGGTVCGAESAQDTEWDKKIRAMSNDVWRLSALPIPLEAKLTSAYENYVLAIANASNLPANSSASWFAATSEEVLTHVNMSMRGFWSLVHHDTNQPACPMASVDDVVSTEQLEMARAKTSDLIRLCKGEPPARPTRDPSSFAAAGSHPAWLISVVGVLLATLLLNSVF